MGRRLCNQIIRQERSQNERNVHRNKHGIQMK